MRLWADTTTQCLPIFNIFFDMHAFLKRGRIVWLDLQVFVIKFVYMKWTVRNEVYSLRVYPHPPPTRSGEQGEKTYHPPKLLQIA